MESMTYKMNYTNKRQNTRL